MPRAERHALRCSCLRIRSVPGHIHLAERDGYFAPPVAGYTEPVQGKLSMPTSVAQFLEQLRSTGLASEEELRALQQSELASDHAADAEPLAQRLVREKKLTLFQATQLYRGRGAALVLGN